MSTQRVAIVGDPSLAMTAETACGRPVVADPADVDDNCGFVVTADEAALVDLAREGVARRVCRPRPATASGRSPARRRPTPSRAPSTEGGRSAVTRFSRGARASARYSMSG